MKGISPSLEADRFKEIIEDAIEYHPDQVRVIDDGRCLEQQLAFKGLVMSVGSAVNNQPLDDQEFSYKLQPDPRIYGETARNMSLVAGEYHPGQIFRVLYHSELGLADKPLITYRPLANQEAQSLIHWLDPVIWQERPRPDSTLSQIRMLSPIEAKLLSSKRQDYASPNVEPMKKIPTRSSRVLPFYLRWARRICW